jgi:signal transduction histidine kinase
MKRYLFYITSFLAILGFIVYSLSFKTKKMDGYEPLIRNGLLDLSEMPTPFYGNFPLYGEIRFFPKQLLVQSDFNKLDIGCKVGKDLLPQQTCKIAPSEGNLQWDSSYFVDFPHIWKNDPNFTISNENPVSYGTYQFKIIQNKFTDLSIFIPNSIYSSFRVWSVSQSNTWKLLGAMGRVSPISESSLDVVGNAVIQIPMDTETIWIEVSNFHSYRPGITSKLWVGEHTVINNQYNDTLILNSYFMGMIFMTGFFNIAIYLMRNKQKESLWLGVFAFLVSIRLWLVSGVYTSDNPFTDIYSLLVRFEYLTIPLCVISFMFYIKDYLMSRIHKMYFGITMTYSLLCILLVLFLPLMRVTSSLYILQIGIILYLIWVLFELIEKLIRPKIYKGMIYRRVRRIFIFILILGIFTVQDILHGAQIIYTGFFLQYGFMIFLVGQSAMLARENAKAWSANESLTAVLQKLVEDKTNSFRKERARAENAIKALEVSQKAQSKAEGDSIINQIAVHIANEVNNPLNFISNGQEIGRESADNIKNQIRSVMEDTAESKMFYKMLNEEFSNLEIAFDKINEGKERILKTITEIKAISGLEGLRMDNFDCIALVEEELKLVRFRYVLDSKNVDWFFGPKNRFQLDANSGRIYSNRYYIARSLRTIFSNALYYVSKREDVTSRRIQIEFQNLEDLKKPFIKILIRNNGPAISSDIESKLFLMSFYEAGGSEIIGLAMVRELLRKVEGDLRLSDTGRTSGWVEFELKLPRTWKSN